jgi:hypothetical protein
MSATVVEGDREDGMVSRPGLAYVEGRRFFVEDIERVVSVAEV